MAANYLGQLILADTVKSRRSPALGAQPAGIGSKAALGMFGASVNRNSLADILMFGEQTSSRVAKIAARGLDNPASLTLDEIKSVCASALTQTADKA